MSRSDGFFRYFHTVIISCYLLFSSPLLLAEQVIKSADYSIHYNAFNSSMLSPEIAKQYDIERSSSLGVINIAVIKDGGKSVTALLQGNAKNAISQLKELKFQKITEGEAIYYIATFNFADKEQVIFNIDVTPDGEMKTTRLEFKQQFFVG